MARVRSKEPEPELVERRALHHLGYRFRLHGKEASAHWTGYWLREVSPRSCGRHMKSGESRAAESQHHGRCRHRMNGRGEPGTNFLVLLAWAADPESRLSHQ